MKHSHPTAARWIVRTTLSAAALAFVVSPFANLAVANATYKEADFASCLERDMPTDYCCEHAGGVMRNGACINPDDLLQPSRPLTSGVLEETQPVPPKKVPAHVLVDMPTMTLAR